MSAAGSVASRYQAERHGRCQQAAPGRSLKCRLRVHDSHGSHACP